MLKNPIRVPSFQTDADGWDVFEQNDFSGGENRQLLPEFIKPNQLQLARNMVMTEEGVLETRLGKVKINTTSLGSGGILSAFRYAKEDGSNYLVVQHGTSLYSYAWDGSSQFSSFGTAIKTGLAAGKKLRGGVWKDNLILTNGTDNIFRFDGAACTDLLGTPPKSFLMAFYAGRMFVVDVANPNWIRFSDLESYDSWPVLNLIKVRDADGDFITGLSSQSGGMVIAKNKAIWTLYGTNKENMRLTDGPTAEVGCTSFDGMLDQGVMVAKDNWYTFNLSGAESLPETHSALLDILTATQQTQIIGQAQVSKQRGYYHLPNEEIVVFDAKRNAITSWTGLNVGCMAQANAEGDEGALLIGDADNGYIYQLTGNDDDGTAIDTVWKTAFDDMKQWREKEWAYFKPEIDILDETGTYEIYVKFNLDYSALKGLTSFTGSLLDFLEWGTDNWGEAYWGTGNESLDEPYWIEGARGDRISFEIKTGNRIRIKGYDTRYRAAGWL
jgi:hypothetical protein